MALAPVPEDKASSATEQLQKQQQPKKKIIRLPQWHAALEDATIEAVSQLKQYDHGWICTVLPATDTKHGVLAILDITNRVRGEGTEPRYMNVGPSPDPTSRDGAIEIVKALLSTMYDPNAGNPKPPQKSPEHDFYVSRRPTWILLDRKFQQCLQLVASLLQTVEVVVKLNTPEALATDPTKVFPGRRATWDAGLSLATADNVAVLDQNADDVWKCSMTMLHDPQSGAKECFLAVEEITNGTDEEKSYALGVGPCPATTVNPDGIVRALLATMLCPRAKEGGDGEARRPGRVVLDKPLEPWLEHIQSKTESIGVTVEI